MDKRSREFKERVYNLMRGEYDLNRINLPESAEVKNEFTEGSECEKLYQEVFDANQRICSRLGVKEDRDVELIISNLLEMAEILSDKMYDYGVYFTDGEKA